MDTPMNNLQGRRPIDEAGHCLLVALESRPVVTLAPACPDDSIDLAGQHYQDSGFGDSTGLYDWLRNHVGTVIGVRYWPFEDTQFLCDALAPLPYVAVAPDRSDLDIYFSDDRRFDPERSRDQDIGVSKVLSAGGAAWALAFDTAALGPAELHALQHLPAYRDEASPGQARTGRRW
jgi:hypothetical protein